VAIRIGTRLRTASDPEQSVTVVGMDFHVRPGDLSLAVTPNLGAALRVGARFDIVDD